MAFTSSQYYEYIRSMVHEKTEHDFWPALYIFETSIIWKIIDQIQQTITFSLSNRYACTRWYTYYLFRSTSYGVFPQYIFIFLDREEIDFLPLVNFWISQNSRSIGSLSVLLNDNDISAKDLLIWRIIDWARAPYSFWNHHCDLFIFICYLLYLLVQFADY